MKRRIVTTEMAEEDKAAESSLRPQRLCEYIGQEKTKHNLQVYIEAAKATMEKLWIMYYFMDLLGLVRQHWLALSPMKWAVI